MEKKSELLEMFYTRGRTSELDFEEYIGVYHMHNLRKPCPVEGRKACIVNVFGE